MMINSILNTIKKHGLIENGECIIVGISGGPDSVCLLHVLKSLTVELNIKIFAVHINHMLRGKESDADEAYVLELCSKLAIPVDKLAVDIKKLASQKGISLEEAGREARYQQFDLVANRVGATKVAVAHNKNDQAETVLMHIMRGTGLDGLNGMDYKRGRIIRPLLDIDRAAIENYCLENHLKPRIDSSNLKSIYTRNKIRLDLIPYINQLFSTDITESIYKMSSLLKDDINYINDITYNLYNGCVNRKSCYELSLNLKKVIEYHPSARKRILRHAIKEIKGDLKGFSSNHIESIYDLILNGRTGSVLHLPASIRVSLSYGVLRIYTDAAAPQSDPFNFIVSIPGTTLISAIDAVLEANIIDDIQNYNQFIDISSTAFEQYFDYEKIKMGICIRNRRDGDIFKPYKSKGTKKLKEYFIDNKIPREIRHEIPLIAQNNEIIWVIGFKISDKFKVTENTKRVIKLKYISKNE